MEKISKIAIIGSGYVGASICYALMLKGIAQEIVLIDIEQEKALGEAWDIMHGIPYMGTARIMQGDFSDCKECDMIIITAGKNRKPGQKRSDLLVENVKILKQISDEVKKYYNGGVFLIVANPVDCLTYYFAKWMGIESNKVIGTGCILDTSRFVSLLAAYVGLSIDNIQATIMGEHGDAQCPIWSRVMVANIPVEEYCRTVGLKWDENVKKEIVQRVNAMGAEIIKRKEKTHYGIATCVAYLADAVINNRMIVASVSSVLQGEYGIEDVALSVPTVIGQYGIKMRLVEEWEEQEIAYLKYSAERLKILRNSIEENGNDI